MLQAGMKAPQFTLMNEAGEKISLSDFAGKKVVVYFYPKDNTPGCTRQACAFAAAYEDYPFDDGLVSSESWTAMRHRGNLKTFAFIFERGGVLTVNLKCRPMEADFLRSVYSCVTPAYHMNKRHWNSVIVNALPEEELYGMIHQSYDLIKPKIKEKKVRKAEK